VNSRGSDWAGVGFENPSSFNKPCKPTNTTLNGEVILRNGGLDACKSYGVIVR
jgi:hypothetical protein